MGKSKNKKQSTINLLALWVQRRKLAKTLTVISGILFFVACIIVGSLWENLRWLIFVFLGIYIICFFSLREASRCPYCGFPIMSKFSTTSHCPKCRRPVKPDATTK